MLSIPAYVCNRVGLRVRNTKRGLGILLMRHLEVEVMSKCLQRSDVNSMRMEIPVGGPCHRKVPSLLLYQVSNARRPYLPYLPHFSPQVSCLCTCLRLPATL